MMIQSETQYWYTRNNERQGPVAGAALVQLARQGGLASTDLVWCDGMPQWTQAAAFDGLFRDASVPPSLGGAPRQAIFPRAPLNKANFGLWLGMMIGYLAFLIIGAIFMGTAGYGDDEMIAVGGFFIFIGVVCLILAVVMGCFNIYRAWAGIQGLPGVAATPARAVGFSFIPFFNLYWVFVAFSKWAVQYNEFVRSNRLPGAPLASEGLFLAFSILVVAGAIPFINYLALLPEMIVGFICMAQMCKLTNYLKTQADAAAG